MKRVMILVVILLTAACEKDKSPTQSTVSNIGTIQVVIDKISGTKKSAADSLQGDTIQKTALVDRVELRVLAKDNTQIASTVLTLNNGYYEGTVTVEAQNDLKVLCIGTNNGIVERFGIDDDVDVQAGKTTTAVITGWNTSYIPTITDSPTHSVEGTYTLNWTEAPSGTEYVLEEANNQVFAAAQTVYSGSTRQFQVSGKEDGTYYYRVQAKNPYNIISGWSTVFSVIVDSMLQQFIISGTISGVDGITISLTGDTEDVQIVVASDGGSYSFTVAEGGTYTVTPSKSGYTFSPSSNTFSNISSNQRQNFTAIKRPTSITFVSIPGGTFQMGDEIGDLWEGCRPVHNVTVSSFDMSTTEITNAQYAMYLNEALASGDITATSSNVTGKTGDYSDREYIYLSGLYSSYPQNECWIRYANYTFNVETGYENWPVVWVTWYGSKAFALYYGLDLPTEAEWEYAARGGKQYEYGTDDGTISTSKVNYWETGIKHPVDVGSYPYNPFKLYDMSGNVWEWCNDWYGNYSSDSITNPTGVLTGSTRVRRGGGWHDSANFCRSAYRTSHNPDYRGYYVGFRVVSR